MMFSSGSRLLNGPIPSFRGCAGPHMEQGRERTPGGLMNQELIEKLRYR